MVLLYADFGHISLLLVMCYIALLVIRIWIKMVEVEFKENYSWYEYFDIRMIRSAKEEPKL